MMTVSIEQAQKSLPELIDRLQPGNEIVITRGDEPVAQLVAMARQPPRPVFGGCHGMLTVLAEDDEHLNDFREYMP